MRIRDLRWKRLPAWPPEWAARSQKSGEDGVLVHVQIRKSRSPGYIYVEADQVGETRWGITILENPQHLESLYLKLKDNIGRSLNEIGDLEINL